MKTKKVWRRAAAILLSLLVCMLSLECTAFAAAGIDPARTASLRVYFGEGTQVFAEVPFSIYYVVGISAEGTYTVSEDFQSYPVTIEEDLTSSDLRALAQTLSAYVARDDVQPVAQAKTGTDGWVSFSGLSAGVYLVLGSQCVRDGVTYTPEPMLVHVPGQSQGEWDYNEAVSCKFSIVYDQPETVTRKVLKIWKDDASSRPQEISVQLLKDGQVVETVQLNEENHWSYTWEDLDASAVWQVTEAQTPAGYTVSVEQEGITFVMTNTAANPPVNPPSPGTPSKPSQPSKPGGRLPQTGMLWWPVPLLICSGLGLLCAGCILRRREDDPHAR